MAAQTPPPCVSDYLKELMKQHLKKIAETYKKDFTVTFTDNVLELKLDTAGFINVDYGNLCTDNDNMAELLVHYIIGRVNTYIINDGGDNKQIQASVDKMVKVLQQFNTPLQPVNTPSKVQWPIFASY